MFQNVTVIRKKHCVDLVKFSLEAYIGKNIVQKLAMETIPEIKHSLKDMKTKQNSL